jgi:hypothetical protein
MKRATGGELDSPANGDGHPGQVLKVSYRCRERPTAFADRQGGPHDLAVPVDKGKRRVGVGGCRFLAVAITRT